MSKIKVDTSFAESVITEEGQAVLGLLGLVRRPAFGQVVRLFLECSGSVIVSGMGKAG
ncbi:MAG: KpsF/GutQ family sugar-phosphate isomerase, partial [Planctomycetota bacterium]